MFSRQQSLEFGKALPVQVSHSFSVDSAVFDDDNLVSCAGLAAIAHNLLRAAATLAGPAHAVARGATLRRKIINIAARLARPQRRAILHLPSHWPWADTWLALWRNVIEPHSPPHCFAA